MNRRTPYTPGVILILSKFFFNPKGVLIGIIIVSTYVEQGEYYLDEFAEEEFENEVIYLSFPSKKTKSIYRKKRIMKR